MPELNYCGSNDNVTDSLPLHHDQQGEQSLLLPSAGKLGVDVELKLKNESFKHTNIQYMISTKSDTQLP
jgi:hypothetical protein